MNFFEKIRNKFDNYIFDSSLSLRDRTFVLFSSAMIVAIFTAMIVGIFLGEPITSTLISLGLVIFCSILLYFVFKMNRIKGAKILVAFLMVGGFQPVMFFAKGGIHCGGLLTLLLGTVYLIMVLEGRFRIVMCIIDVFVLGACWIVGYTRPELVVEYSLEADYVYSFAKYIIFTLVLIAVITFWTRILKKEAKVSEDKSKELEELNRAQNRFFSSMSHEIRTPINSILGLNELILRDTGISDEVAKDASGIQGAGKMLLALINDILDFSKMEAGSMDIVPVDYRIGDMLSEVVNMIWLKAHEKGLKFEVSVDPKVPAVLYGDEVRIKQIIINLLNNAVKYTQEGSVELHVESENTTDDRTTLSITISDTGMGIKKEALPYLFDAFKRVDEEKNRHIEGTGLGLSIVKQLAELMGGNVVVNSVYGEGSTFIFTITQKVSDATAIGELNIHNQSVARDKYEASFVAPDARVLIVDDNEMNLEVEKKLLTDTKILVDTAISGRLALEYAVQIHYDVILMDHLMPGMDGIDCLKALRGQTGGLNRTTPVVVLTANAGSENRELYNRSGFDGYLVKPVSGEALEEMLMKHISKDKLTVAGKMMRMKEDINTTAGYSRKLPVIITTTSMADIPE
nr:response regulator [Lachnospiraceae bacterium]